MKTTTRVQELRAKAIAKDLKIALRAIKRAHSLVMADAPNTIQEANRLAELSHTINYELNNYNNID